MIVNSYDRYVSTVNNESSCETFQQEPRNCNESVLSGYLFDNAHTSPLTIIILAGTGDRQMNSLLQCRVKRERKGPLMCIIYLTLL